jgi:LAO/AO transport system kinase
MLDSVTFYFDSRVPLASQYDILKILKGDRRALAKAISTVELGGMECRKLMAGLYPHTGDAFTIGITGPSGTGKSTLVNRLIEEYRRRGLKVGVLAIDPSSAYTGGALLGDRLRMMDHSLERDVYIRSMASRGSLGGLARAARNTMRVLDAAGMNVVIVETVGAGQTEVEVATAVDATVVVLMPQLGDEIQAFKAGFNEIGDIFVVNKSDILNPAKTIYNIATGIMEKNGWRPPVIKTVALKGTGIVQLVDAVEKFRIFLDSNGLSEKRRRQHLEEELLDASFSDFHSEMMDRLKQSKSWSQTLDLVVKKELDPETAASKLVKTIGKLDS